MGLLDLMEKGCESFIALSRTQNMGRRGFLLASAGAVAGVAAAGLTPRRAAAGGNPEDIMSQYSEEKLLEQGFRPYTKPGKECHIDFFAVDGVEQLFTYDEHDKVLPDELHIMHYIRGSPGTSKVERVELAVLPNGRLFDVGYHSKSKRWIKVDTDGDGTADKHYDMTGKKELQLSLSCDPKKLGFFQTKDKKGRNVWKYNISVEDYYNRALPVDDKGMPEGLRWWPGVDQYMNKIKAITELGAKTFNYDDWHKNLGNSKVRQAIYSSLATNGTTVAQVERFISSHPNVDAVSFYRDGYFVLSDISDRRKYVMKVPTKNIRRLVG